MRPLVIYHADCTDGFGAAFAAWLRLGDAAEYLPMQYGQAKLHETLPFNPLNREVYIFDFSFERQIMEFIFRDARRVVWLDHHKTAFEMWCGGHEKGACYERALREILLDENKSGAMLAWEHFNPAGEPPLWVRLIDDRDRWQFKIPGSKEFHAAMGARRPWTFEQWRLCVDTTTDVLLVEGAAILRAQDQSVAQAVKAARKCIVRWEHGTFRGADTGLAVNSPLHQSEIGHELATMSGAYGLVWCLGADGKVKCSLRSNGDYDVSVIAKAFGGGGHRNAAGFETDIDTLKGWLT